MKRHSASALKDHREDLTPSESSRLISSPDPSVSPSLTLVSRAVRKPPALTLIFSQGPSLGPQPVRPAIVLKLYAGPVHLREPGVLEGEDPDQQDPDHHQGDLEGHLEGEARREPHDEGEPEPEEEGLTEQGPGVLRRHDIRGACPQGAEW